MSFNNNPYSQDQNGQDPSQLFPTLWNTQEDTEKATTVILSKVFLRMFAALIVTAIISFTIYSSNSLINAILQYPEIVIVAAVVQIGVVLAMSFGANKFSANVANVLFFVYAALTGLVLSIVFIALTIGVIVQAFAIAALMFAAMAAYGIVAKKDLTRIGSLLFMGLIGVILASFINILFFRNDAMSMIINYVVVVIFLGLTAYDTQRIKNMIASINSGAEGAMVASSKEEAIKKISVFGALNLYLNFINLFLRILAILGRRR